MGTVTITEETFVVPVEPQTFGGRTWVGPKESVLATTIAKCAFSFAAGATIAAVASYFLDPIRGHARQARIRDKALSLEHRAVRVAGRSARNVRNHAKGIVARTVPGAAAMMKRSRHSSPSRETAFHASAPAPLSVEPRVDAHVPENPAGPSSA
jgi:hypothetical protein